MPMKEEIRFTPTVVTLIVIIGWAFFMLLHVLFWSGNYNLFQNVVILFLSLVIVACFLGILWMYWEFRRAPKERDNAGTERQDQWGH
jgi:membrane-bound acyltransferase YfiQ involved in biofilm formation